MALTPDNLALAERGFGLATFDQDAPFQCTISVRAAPLFVLRVPTAQALLPEVALTPDNAPAIA